MIAKEWRDARWKLFVGMLVMLVSVTIYLIPYEWVENDIQTPPPTEGPDGAPMPFEVEPVDAIEWPLFNMLVSYEAGKPVLAVLAVVLGAALISGEVGRGTIFLLLAKPVSRERILFTKYTVGAAVLLAVALVGSIGLILAAYIKGYPVGYLGLAGAVLSTALLWLGSLFVFGATLLVSTVLGDTVKSLVVSLPVALLTFVVPVNLMGLMDYYRLVQNRTLITPDDLPRNLFLSDYWSSESLYLGNTYATTNFLICLIAALVPLLAALWLFNRKAY